MESNDSQWFYNLPYIMTLGVSWNGGDPTSWMVEIPWKKKKQTKMDDNWGYPHDYGSTSIWIAIKMDWWPSPKWALDQSSKSPNVTDVWSSPENCSIFWGRSSWKKHENSGPKCYTHGGPTADRLLSVKVNRLSERLAPSWHQLIGSAGNGWISHGFFGDLICPCLAQ